MYSAQKYAKSGAEPAHLRFPVMKSSLNQNHGPTGRFQEQIHGAWSGIPMHGAALSVAHIPALHCQALEERVV
jgi:hypothetical protein